MRHKQQSAKERARTVTAHDKLFPDCPAAVNGDPLSVFSAPVPRLVAWACMCLPLVARWFRLPYKLRQFLHDKWFPGCGYPHYDDPWAALGNED